MGSLLFFSSTYVQNTFFKKCLAIIINMFIGNRSFYKYNYRIPVVLNLYITQNSIFIHFYKDFLLNLPMFISVSIF